jgi:hypothetical protein
MAVSQGNLIPWQWEHDPSFLPATIKSRTILSHVDYLGHPRLGQTLHSAEDIIFGRALPNIGDIIFPNPNEFVAAHTSCCSGQWHHIVEGTQGSQVLSWIQQGVNAYDFFHPYKGTFQGEQFDSPLPPPRSFNNAKICQRFRAFVAATLVEDLASGAVSLLGRVGEVSPPLVVSPITIEPSKPRLCVDLRYLNCWVKDTPFTLDTLKEVPRLIDVGAWMTKIDKCGYKNVFIHPACRTFFGFQWAGYYFQYNVLVFGWKSSAFCYQGINQQVAGYLRRLNIPVLTFIDDRWLEQLRGTLPFTMQQDNFAFLRAQIAVYAACQIVVRLGFFVNLSKSILIPQQVLLFLGLHIHSIEGAFSVPLSKREKFQELREYILSQSLVSLHTIQRFVGRCVSFMLAIPGARLYTSEANRAISRATQHESPIRVAGPLREEIEHWRFLDRCTQLFSWRHERHEVFRLSSDASHFRWGLSSSTDGQPPLEGGDYFDEELLELPIMAKEAWALYFALESLSHTVHNKRVEAQVDNMVLLHSWNNEGSRSQELNKVLKKIFTFVLQHNIDLVLSFVPSGENPADCPSRRLQKIDAMLSARAWLLVQQQFGGSRGHTVDLMSQILSRQV